MTWTQYIPHFFSISRIVIALLIWFFPSQELLLAYVIWGAFSDWADGYLARRWGVVSRLGALLDPLGDKALIGSFVLFFYLKGELPTWWVACALGRDILIILGGLIVLRVYGVKDMPPTFVSKMNTVLQFGALLGAMIPFFSIHAILIISTMTTLYSFFQYIVFFRSLHFSSRSCEE